MCLIADRDTTFLFEQPELHLHPRVQSRLGDFFLSMTFLHKQCIVETHSEYLINKIRYRIVEEKDDKTNIRDSVKLYFAEKKDDCTNFKELEINKYGVISEWPDGFFDEGQNLARDILIAGIEKRKGGKNKR
jgi:predicted ATPase